MLAEATCGAQAHVYVVKILDQIDAVKSSENPGTLKVRKAPNRSYAEKKTHGSTFGVLREGKKGVGQVDELLCRGPITQEPKSKKDQSSRN